MKEPALTNLTVLLEKAQQGDQKSEEQVFNAVYLYLREIAKTQRIKSGAQPDLNTTALVNEAYLKLAKSFRGSWNDRSHFFAVAATAMRHILVNHAAKQLAAKRGGGAPKVDLDENLLVGEESAGDLIAVHQALKKLAEVEPRMAHVVECRFFAGLTIKQTAEALNMSTATVTRDYRDALSWLYNELGEPSGA